MDTLFSKATQAYNNLQGEVKRISPDALFCTSGLLKKQFEGFKTITLARSNPHGLREKKDANPLFL